MSKIAKWIGIGVAVAGTALFLFVNQTMADKEEAAQHTVEKGDSLWRITSSYLKDPFLWPKVWKANPDIKNPDRIYPGQRIAIPGVAAKPATAEAKTEEKPAEAAPTAKGETAAPEHPVPVAEAKPAAIEPTLKKLIASSGYVGPIPSGAGEVVGSWDSKAILAQEDIIYIAHGPDLNPAAGSQVSIVRPLRPVIHPVTRQNLGFLVKSLGYAEVTATDGKVATARVVRSYDAIEEGDRVVSLIPDPSATDMMVPGEVTPMLKGYIVDTADFRVVNGQLDIVYLDRGRQDGVRVGAKFAVLLPGLPKKARWSGEMVRLPHQLVSEARVIAIQDRTATALVTKSYKEIESGYEVESRP